MRRVQGTVLAVFSEAQGGTCLSWQGTSMLVADASDFSREGGQFTFDGETVYSYLGVTEGEAEDAPDVVTTVEQGSVTDEARVDLWPLALDVTAEIQTDTDEALPCVVPHMLRPLLEDGIRDTDRENVWVERRGQQWVVVEVIGRAALVQPEAISQGTIDHIAAEVQPPILQRVNELISTSATGQNQNIYSINPPPSTWDGAIGDTWWQMDSQTATVSIARFRWSTEGWQQVTIDGQQIDNLDAGSIVTGALQGVSIYSPNAGAIPRLQVQGSVIQIIRSDGEVEFASLTLGGPEGDQVQIVRDGVVVAGFDPDGNLVAQHADVSSLSVDGEPWDGVLDALPGSAMQPMVFDLPSNTAKAGTAELGICDMGWTAIPGHLYRIEVHGYWLIPPNERAQIFLRSRTAGNGVIDVPAPTIATSTSEGSAIIHAGSRGGNISGGMVLYWRTDYPSPSGVRFLLTIKALDSNVGGVGVGTGGAMVVTDLGRYDGAMQDGQLNTGGGVPLSGSTSAPPASKVTYKSTWNYSHAKSWRGGSEVSDALHFGTFDGIQRFSSVWFVGGAVSGEVGKTPQQALAGASNVRLWLRFTVTHSYSSTGVRVRIGHVNNAPGGAQQTSGGEAFTTGVIGKGATATPSLPSAWAARFAAGTSTGVTFGEGASASNDSYGKAAFKNGSGVVTASLVQLIAEYTR